MANCETVGENFGVVGVAILGEVDPLGGLEKDACKSGEFGSELDFIIAAARSLEAKPSPLPLGLASRL